MISIVDGDISQSGRKELFRVKRIVPYQKNSSVSSSRRNLLPPVYSASSSNRSKRWLTSTDVYVCAYVCMRVFVRARVHLCFAACLAIFLSLTKYVSCHSNTKNESSHSNAMYTSRISDTWPHAWVCFSYHRFYYYHFFSHSHMNST